MSTSYSHAIGREVGVLIVLFIITFTLTHSPRLHTCARHHHHSDKVYLSVISNLVHLYRNDAPTALYLDILVLSLYLPSKFQSLESLLVNSFKSTLHELYGNDARGSNSEGANDDDGAAQRLQFYLLLLRYFTENYRTMGGSGERGGNRAGTHNSSVDSGLLNTSSDGSSAAGNPSPDISQPSHPSSSTATTAEASTTTTSTTAAAAAAATTMAALSAVDTAPSYDSALPQIESQSVQSGGYSSNFSQTSSSVSLNLSALKHAISRIDYGPQLRPIYRSLSWSLSCCPPPTTFSYAVSFLMSCPSASCFYLGWGPLAVLAREVWDFDVMLKVIKKKWEDEKPYRFVDESTEKDSSSTTTASPSDASPASHPLDTMYLLLSSPSPSSLLTLYNSLHHMCSTFSTLLTYSRTVTTTSHAISLAADIANVAGKGVEIWSKGWIGGGVAILSDLSEYLRSQDADFEGAPPSSSVGVGNSSGSGSAAASSNACLSVGRCVTSAQGIAQEFEAICNEDKNVRESVGKVKEVTMESVGKVREVTREGVGKVKEVTLGIAGKGWIWGKDGDVSKPSMSTLESSELAILALADMYSEGLVGEGDKKRLVEMIGMGSVDEAISELKKIELANRDGNDDGIIGDANDEDVDDNNDDNNDDSAGDIGGGGNRGVNYNDDVDDDVVNDDDSGNKYINHPQTKETSEELLKSPSLKRLAPQTQKRRPSSTSSMKSYDSDTWEDIVYDVEDEEGKNGSRQQPHNDACKIIDDYCEGKGNEGSEGSEGNESTCVVDESINGYEKI